MDDLMRLLAEQAVGAAIGFVLGVVAPAALLVARKKAKQTPNKLDDILVDALIRAVNEREEKEEG